MATVIQTLQEAGQDFEWYPTTDEMIAAVVKHIKGTRTALRPYYSPGSILDIGAGDGRVLTALGEAFECRQDLYAIEKAAPHIENMPANIAIVGTDFHYQTLIDKDVSMIFCNPPYSEYENWAVKIIKEALSDRIYLIVPKRWARSKPIRSALKLREVEAEVIWSGDFRNAERKARASVDIIYVAMRRYDGEYDHQGEKTDPFETWFQETFPEVEAVDHVPQEPPIDVRMNNELMAGYNLVDRLVALYEEDLKKMQESYRALCRIDPALLKEVGVTAAQVKDGLRQKIKGLKNKYWEELFDHLDKIKQRLTHKSRDKIVGKMSSAVHVDFTSDNAYAVVIWVLKNTNQYIESQLVDLFTELSRPENVRNYKSNQKTWKQEQWRYSSDEKHTHYMLEYRIIATKWHGSAIKPNDKEWRSDYDYPNGLHNDSHALLGDIITVANNLDFACHDSSRSCWHGNWTSGGAEVFELANGETLMRVRAFINGNIHIQFNQDFIKALNIEASRILGWIRSPQEACEEMGVDFFTAQRCFQSNRIFAPSDLKRLTA